MAKRRKNESAQPSKKPCSVCQKNKSLESFARNKKGRYGRKSQCKDCERRKKQAARKHGTEEPEPLGPLREDLDPLTLDAHFELAGTDWSGQANRQKRQEYNRMMGHTAEFLHDVAAGDDVSGHPIKRLTPYISSLAEDERRYTNRKRARSVSIAHARDMLFVRAFEEMASRTMRGKITPKGYSTRRTEAIPKRITNLLLSDLHIGATLDSRELPEGFGFVEASRRLAYVVQQAADYKPQYRDHQTLNVYLGGDVIEGLLGHDQADGAPLTEQCIAFLQYIGAALAYLAAAYPHVVVWCETGNHGRNKLRHEGRATNQKWDSTETVLYVALKMMAERLENVSFRIPRAPAVVVPLFDRHLLLTHGDTHLKIADPDKKAETYEIALNKINGNLEYGQHIDVLAVGHFHKGRMLRFRRSSVLVNGALVPPNGHAKTSGYDTACGQWIWESVPGHALGDARFVDVGQEQDADESLDSIIAPFQGWD